MPIETSMAVLSGIVIAVVSGATGKVIGSNGRVHEETCEERRLSCTKVLGIKIDNLSEKVDKLERTINDKIIK